MELLKKNLDLIVAGLVCVVLAVLLGLAIRGSVNSAGNYEREVDKQGVFFRGLQSGGSSDAPALNQSNLDVARANSEKAKALLLDFQKRLAERHGVPEETYTPLRSAQMLRNECAKIVESMEKKKVELDRSCAELTFGSEMNSSVLPQIDQIPKIFRTLRIIEEMLRLLAEAQVSAVKSITRPADYAMTNHGTHESMPLEITITGSAEKIRNAINLLQTGPKFLYFIKEVRMIAGDQVSAGCTKLFTDMDAYMSRPAKTAEATGAAAEPAVAPGIPPEVLAATAPAAPAPSGPVLINLNKIDRLILNQHQVTATIRLDFVQFKKPD